MTDSDTKNYRGELFAIGYQKAPFLAAIASNAKRCKSRTFPIALPWSLSAASQDTESEDTAATASGSVTVTTSQDVNVIQIQKKEVELTLMKQSLIGQFDGINVDGYGTGLTGIEFQKFAQLRQMAVDSDFSCLQGTYLGETDSSTNCTTRGLKNAITTNTRAAGGAALDSDMIEEVIREMVGSGAMFMRPAIVGDVFQIQRLSAIYGYAPQDRTMGGVAIDKVLVPGCPAGALPVISDPQMPSGELYFVDLALCAPVFLPVPPSVDEANASVSYSQDGLDIAYYQYGTVAAKKGGFLYMQFGFDYGAEEMHGSITGLATSA